MRHPTQQIKITNGREKAAYEQPFEPTVAAFVLTAPLYLWANFQL